MACGRCEVGCVVVVVGREDVSSACGLARSPSGHFASAVATGNRTVVVAVNSDDGILVAAGNRDDGILVAAVWCLRGELTELAPCMTVEP